MNLDELVESAAFELVGLHPDDQRAALSTACECFAEGLQLARPELTANDIRCACYKLARRVRARLREIEAQQVSASVH